MRPKLVLTVFLLGMAILSVALLFWMLKPVGDSQSAPEPAPAVAEAVVQPPTNPQPAQVTSLVALTPEEEVEERVQKGLAEIRNALLAGTDDPNGLFKVLDKITSPDADVRKAAIEAVRHLDNRAALPRLKEALPHLEDPEDRVAVLETIKYIEIPDSTEEPVTNLAPGVLPFSAAVAKTDRRAAGRSNAPVQPK